MLGKKPSTSKTEYGINLWIEANSFSYKMLSTSHFAESGNTLTVQLSQLEEIFITGHKIQSGAFGPNLKAFSSE